MNETAPAKRVALVTGASRGVGRAIAMECARQGYHLGLICHNRMNLLDDVINECQSHGVMCRGYQGNVAEPDFIDAVVEDMRKTLGEVSVLVNNAGVAHIGLLTDLSYDAWQTILNTNLTSIYNTCHAVVPDMVRQKSGQIVNISSVWGNVGASCEVAYSASKGGVNAFTKALAKELAPSGIRVNAIALGVIDTQMNQQLDNAERQMLADEIPMGRFGYPDEAAKLVLSVIHAPDYLTGQIITMDGGWF